MIDKIKKNLLKDEEILWIEVKIQNLKRRMLIGVIIFGIVFTIYNLLFWVPYANSSIDSSITIVYVISVSIFDFILGGLPLIGMILAFRAKKLLRYTNQDLTNYERISILTNKRLIQRGMNFFYKINTPRTQETINQDRSDVVFIDLNWIEKIMHYKSRKHKRIQFFLNDIIIVDGPPFMYLKLTPKNFEELWIKINGIIPLKKDEIESTDNFKFFYREGGNLALKSLDTGKNIIGDSVKYCPHCGANIDSEEESCISCGQKTI